MDICMYSLDKYLLSVLLVFNQVNQTKMADWNTSKKKHGDIENEKKEDKMPALSSFFTSLVKFIPRYFILSVAIVNRIVFIIFPSASSLLAYRNATIFCIEKYTNCFVYFFVPWNFTISNSILVGPLGFYMTSLMAQMIKHLQTMWEAWVQPLGREDLLEKEMATHSIYKIMSSINSNSFTFCFSPFVLTGTSSGDSGIPVLFLILQALFSGFHHWVWC